MPKHAGGYFPLQPPFESHASGQKSDLPAQLPFVQTLAGKVDEPSLHLQPTGAQLLTPPFFAPHGEPGGSSVDELPELDEVLPELEELEELEELVPPLDEPLLLAPMPHGRSPLLVRSWQLLFSRQVACASVMRMLQSASHVSDGSGELHSVAFTSQRALQLAASGSVDAVDVLPPSPFDGEPVPVDVDVHANARHASAATAPTE